MGEVKQMLSSPTALPANRNLKNMQALKNTKPHCGFHR